MRSTATVANVLHANNTTITAKSQGRCPGHGDSSARVRRSGVRVDELEPEHESPSAGLPYEIVPIGKLRELDYHPVEVKYTK